MQVRCTHASSAEADQLLSFLPSGNPVSRVLSVDIQNLLYQFLEVSGNGTPAVLLSGMCVVIVLNSSVLQDLRLSMLHSRSSHLLRVQGSMQTM